MTERPHCLNREACKASTGPKAGTHCRSCATIAKNRTAEHREAASVGMSRFLSDPDNRERLAQRRRQQNEAMKADPVARARWSEQGRLHGPRNIRHAMTPEARAKAGRSGSATKLAHIPEAMRPDYRALRGKGLSAAEREAIVRESVPQAARRDVRRTAEAMERAEAKRRRDSY